MVVGESLIKSLKLSLLALCLIMPACASLEDRCLVQTEKRGVAADLRREYYRQCVEEGRTSWGHSRRRHRHDDED